MTKIIIVVDYTLAELKQAYRNFHGGKDKITKDDVSTWLGGLAEADVSDYVNQIPNDEEN